jgi:hypothetical protein
VVTIFNLTMIKVGYIAKLDVFVVIFPVKYTSRSTLSTHLNDKTGIAALKVDWRCEGRTRMFHCNILKKIQDFVLNCLYLCVFQVLKCRRARARTRESKFGEMIGELS